jgi:hypothetical protein
MTKFGKFGDYPPRSLESAEAALLTAWRSLEQYHDDLVLVGGLAVHYLTRREISVQYFLSSSSRVRSSL